MEAEAKLLMQFVARGRVRYPKVNEGRGQLSMMIVFQHTWFL